MTFATFVHTVEPETSELRALVHWLRRRKVGDFADSDAFVDFVLNWTPSPRARTAARSLFAMFEKCASRDKKKGNKR
jgi:hypothetical protein